VIVGAYIGDREPACSSGREFVRSHASATEFRDGNDVWGKTCTALDVDGSVIAVQHYPTRTDWIAAGLVLFVPLTVLAATRAKKGRRSSRRASPSG
jgi:hypothetical protein